MFTPHTDRERADMLAAVGVNSLEELFEAVPAKFRFPQLNLPPALSEMEAMAQMQELSQANESTHELACFLGAGAYNHYIPSAVDQLLRRGEFYSAYTPYQPEIAQGTLQAIFEFQSLIVNLTGMDISNASHYDGATATAEAAVLAYHHFRGKRNRIILSPGVHPHFRQTLRTYMHGYEDIQIVGDEPGADTFATPDQIKSLLNLSTSLVVVGYPDFFGRLFDYTDLANACHEVGALLCIAVNPMALALFKTPGDFGADIVVGEGQSLGIPLSLGGPYLGIFATKKDLLRRIAGRLVGETVDEAGQRGYVLTLTAREQHIRREKATSNICTNQGLLALCATIYTSLLGKSGLRKVAELCYHKAHYAAEEIGSLPGYRLVTQTPFFNEFVIQTPQPVSEINSHLLDHGILGGFDLSREYPELKDHMLIAITEMNSRDEIDMLRDALQEVKNG